MGTKLQILVLVDFFTSGTRNALGIPRIKTTNNKKNAKTENNNNKK